MERPSEGELVQRFVRRCIATYTSRGLPADLLGSAMLAESVNLMIETDGAEQTAYVLAGLGASIVPVQTQGNA